MCRPNGEGLALDSGGRDARRFRGFVARQVWCVEAVVEVGGQPGFGGSAWEIRWNSMFGTDSGSLPILLDGADGSGFR